MQRRTWTGWRCLALFLAASSISAAWLGSLAAAANPGPSHGQSAAAGIPVHLVAQYGAGSPRFSGGNTFAARNMFSGGGASFYHGYHHGPVVGGGAVVGGGYVPYYGSYSVGMPYSPYYYGPYVAPPLFVPADNMFGPGPLMQGIGNLVPADDGGMAGGGNAPRGVRNVPAQPQQPGQAAGGPAVQLQKKVRITNAASKARAGKFLQSGDAQFVKQKFHQALQRYREGALSAPDLGDCFFRQAFAEVAMGQYDAASKAIQRGLWLKPDWADSDFTLDSLYGAEHHLTKLSHREGLAQAIEQNPLDGGLYLAMGAMLYFDGQRDRSRPFFEKAAQLNGKDGHLLDGFLAPMPADAENRGPLDRVPDNRVPDNRAPDKAAAKPASKINL